MPHSFQNITSVQTIVLVSRNEVRNVDVLNACDVNSADTADRLEAAKSLDLKHERKNQILL